MKKAIRIALIALAVIVLALLAIVLTLPLTIGPIVRTAASVGGPRALGVPVSIGDVRLRPLSGDLTVSQVSVGNPEGYSEKPMFAVDKIDVGLRMGSLFSGDTIVIRHIRIDAPAISYERQDGKANFDAILANAKKAEQAEQAQAPRETAPGKRVVIEEFQLNGAQLAYTSGLTFGKPLSMTLPAITVRDIGKADGGASPVEVVNEVLTAVVGSLGKAATELTAAAGKAITDVGGAATDAAKGATDAAADAAKGATDAAADAAKGATDAARDAARNLKNLFR